MSFWLARGGVFGSSTLKSVDALAGLFAKLPHALAARGGFPSDGGTQESYRAVLLCELRLELVRLS
jgi:hypothetical protein